MPLIERQSGLFVAMSAIKTVSSSPSARGDILAYRRVVFKISIPSSIGAVIIGNSRTEFRNGAEHTVRQNAAQFAF